MAKQHIQQTNDYYSVPQLAQKLGISRVALFKRIKKGQIKAEKVGRRYLIPKTYLSDLNLQPSKASSIDAKQYLTIPQAAELLGLSRVAVYFQVQKGKIPAKKIGGEYLIKKSIITQIDEPKQEEQKDDITKKYYSVAELSQLFGINRQTVARKIKEGKIPATRVGRHYVIDENAIDEGAPLEDIQLATQNEDYISVMDLAKQLGVSRIAVFKKIKKGQIQAIKIGRSYAINKHTLRLFFKGTGK